jgi:hypothetical protein
VEPLAADSMPCELAVPEALNIVAAGFGRYQRELRRTPRLELTQAAGRVVRLADLDQVVPAPNVIDPARRASWIGNWRHTCRCLAM